MARFLSDPDTVSNSERTLERLTGTHLPKPPNKVHPDPKPVTLGRTQNFTCPACMEVLKEAISINGRIQGWCGTTHTYIKKEV